MPIIHLHASNPEINAAMNPIIRAPTPTPDSSVNLPSKKSFKFAPIIGTNTIRKENFAMPSFLFFSNNPVDIVAPDLEMPGKTSNAWQYR